MGENVNPHQVPGPRRPSPSQGLPSSSPPWPLAQFRNIKQGTSFYKKPQLLGDCNKQAGKLVADKETVTRRGLVKRLMSEITQDNLTIAESPCLAMREPKSNSY